MALKDTIHTLKELMCTMGDDLEKVSRGNKAAGQRVRTHSIKFAKVAKIFRKESVSSIKKEESKNNKKFIRTLKRMSPN